VRVWTGFIWLGIRTGSGTEPSGSIKDGKILTSRAAILASQDELCSIKLFTCHNFKYNRLPLPGFSDDGNITNFRNVVVLITPTRWKSAIKRLAQ
jgi:hypothetical protein